MENLTEGYQWNSEHIRYSNPHCVGLVWYSDSYFISRVLVEMHKFFHLVVAWKEVALESFDLCGAVLASHRTKIVSFVGQLTWWRHRRTWRQGRTRTPRAHLQPQVDPKGTTAKWIIFTQTSLYNTVPATNSCAFGIWITNIWIRERFEKQTFTCSLFRFPVIVRYSRCGLNTKLKVRYSSHDLNSELKVCYSSVVCCCKPNNTWIPNF